MSHDKTTSTIGKLLGPEAQRDAVHFAVAPVIASCSLEPGQHVGLLPNGKATSMLKGTIGIVDPFLVDNVNSGERFWLFLYPQTVTGMRHEWQHPAFQDEKTVPEPFTPEWKKEQSKKWLRNFGASTGYDYEDLMERLGRAITSGSVNAGDDDTADRFTENRRELFLHYAIVTGRTITEEQIEGVYFSCAC